MTCHYNFMELQAKTIPKAGGKRAGFFFYEGKSNIRVVRIIYSSYIKT